MADEVTKPSNVADMFKPKLYGMAAKREAAKKALEGIDPTKVETKLAIVFDDSSSMNGEKIRNAHIGVRQFSNNCNPRDTAIAIYPLNKESKPLTIQYDVLNLYVGTINAAGGTPLYGKTQEMLNSTDGYTRGVVFSDGEPTDNNRGYGEEFSKDQHQATIELALSKRIPLDCIFLGQDYEKGFKIMKELAEKTGGTFVHFKDAASLGAGLKYLAPALRGLLANPEIKARIERGETI